EERRLVGDELLAERRAERGDHGALLGRQDAVAGAGVAAPDPEFGAADVDDVALGEQTRRLELLPVDVAAIGAAEVGEHELAALRIEREARVLAADARGDEHEAVVL